MRAKEMVASDCKATQVRGFASYKLILTLATLCALAVGAWHFGIRPVQRHRRAYRQIEIALLKLVHPAGVGVYPTS